MGKKSAVATAGILGAASAFAEGESAAIDTSVATDALDQMTTAVTGFVRAAAPYLVTILGACLAIALVWIAWKLIKKGTNKA